MERRRWRGGKVERKGRKRGKWREVEGWEVEEELEGMGNKGRDGSGGCEEMGFRRQASGVERSRGMGGGEEGGREEERWRVERRE